MKRARKKSGGQEGEGERRELALTPTPLSRCFFFLLTSFCTVPMVWTPGTGYAKGGNIACSFILVCLLKVVLYGQMIQQLSTNRLPSGIEKKGYIIIKYLVFTKNPLKTTK